MSNESHNETQSIRQFCDGELGPDETARVEQQVRADPALKARVEFERKLRDRVDSILDTECPADLRGCVKAAMAEAAEPRPLVVARAMRSMRSMRSRWREPARANVFAVAASLALVAGAVLFGIFGRPIDTWRGPAPTDIASSEVTAAVAGEHFNLASDPVSLDAHLEFKTPERAGAELSGYLEQVFNLSDLGYEFAGGQTCRVPRCEKGCHLFYKRIGKPPGIVSLHIVPDGGLFQGKGAPSLNRLPIATDIFPENSRCQKDVLVWSHGNRSYMLVVCRPQDVEKVARRMQTTLVEGHGDR